MLFPETDFTAALSNYIHLVITLKTAVIKGAQLKTSDSLGYNRSGFGAISIVTPFKGQMVLQVWKNTTSNLFITLLLLTS